mmetsp:Transcript_15982/g.48495  ORF Transcript_15982/g.48495 Transcript_15982/m.48495 type:complete len:212 (+) Transcript_15982:99-734(+)
MGKTIHQKRKRESGHGHKKSGRQTTHGLSRTSANPSRLEVKAALSAHDVRSALKNRQPKREGNGRLRPSAVSVYSPRLHHHLTGVRQADAHPSPQTRVPLPSNSMPQVSSCRVSPSSSISGCRCAGGAAAPPSPSSPPLTSPLEELSSSPSPSLSPSSSSMASASYCARGQPMASFAGAAAPSASARRSSRRSGVCCTHTANSSTRHRLSR